MHCRTWCVVTAATQLYTAPMIQPALHTNPNLQNKNTPALQEYPSLQECLPPNTGVIAAAQSDAAQLYPAAALQAQQAHLEADFQQQYSHMQSVQQ